MVLISAVFKIMAEAMENVGRAIEIQQSAAKPGRSNRQRSSLARDLEH